MTMKTKRLTIGRAEINKQNYDNITVQMIDKEQAVPVNSVLLKVLYHVLSESRTEV